MTGQTRAVEKLAERNIRKWTQAEHARARLAQGEVRANVGPYVVVSREFGAGGAAIAHAVGAELGWDTLDKQIVDRLASQYGTPRSLVEHMDEKNVGWIEQVFTSWLEGQGFSSAAYVHRLNQLMLLAAHHGNVVIVGRGAPFILPREGGLFVRILAPLEFRVEQVLLQHGLTEKEARKLVQATDRKREDFVKQHFRQKASDPHAYDLVINVEKLGRADATNLIVDAARAWMREHGIAAAPAA